MRTAEAVLGGSGLPHALALLGLRDDDLASCLAVAAEVLGRVGDLAVVDRLAAALRQGIDRFPGEPDREPWPGYVSQADPYGVGVLPLLALVATAPDLAAFHRSRGVPAEVSARTLTELGQQAWVHRRTSGGFGLHTYGWLPVAWSGSLYWLGRLQFNLELLADGWVCSTHIPESGPLDPKAVDRSFDQAGGFFARHFPERGVRDLWCCSWLLDPALAAALDPGSNLARFQRRWRLYGEPMPGDEDALFFTFHRRGNVDLSQLPRDTTLQRVIIDRLRAGRHWQLWHGRCPQPQPERLRS